MNEDDLIKLAAKAAGIYWFDEPALLAGKGLHMKSGPFWNPLTDDGDALRLAVKLGLDLLRTDQDVEALAGLPPYVKADQPHAVAPFGIVALGDDPYAATRRAITRAAAAIGEGMK